MGQPSQSSVHVNRPLTNILVAWIQSQPDFIASQVFPIVPVEKKSDSYFVFPKGEWYRDTAQERAPGTESAGGGFNVETDTYNCKEVAWHQDIADPVRANSDDPLDLDKAGTEFVGRKILINRETRFVTGFFKGGIWTGAADYTPSTKWDAANSTPIEDVEAKTEEIRLKHGYKPNRLVVTPDVHSVLKNHPDIVDRVKYTQKGIITEELIAQVFGVEKYLVARAVKNSAAEGATDSMSSIFGTKACLLVYAASSPSLYAPSGGYIMSWKQYMGAVGGARIKKFRMEELESDRIEGQISQDMKQVAADMGCYFTAVIS